MSRFFERIRQLVLGWPGLWEGEKILKKKFGLWKWCMVACAVIFCLGIAVSGKCSYAAVYEYGDADEDGFLIRDGILEKYLGTDT